MILGGELQTLCALRASPGIGGLLVDPAEIRSRVRRETGLLPPCRVFAALQVSHAVGKALIAERPEGAIVGTVPIQRGAPRGTPGITMSEIARFRTEFATLGHLRIETGRHVKQLIRPLEEARVPLAFDPGDSGTRIYRRRIYRTSPGLSPNSVNPVWPPLRRPFS